MAISVIIALILLKAIALSNRTIQNLENLRNRLRDMVNGDPYVDMGTLLYVLNENIAELGGNKIELRPDEIRPRFFEESTR